jgi:hypothetical protein
MSKGTLYFHVAMDQSGCGGAPTLTRRPVGLLEWPEFAHAWPNERREGSLRP